MLIPINLLYVEYTEFPPSIEIIEIEIIEIETIQLENTEITNIHSFYSQTQFSLRSEPFSFLSMNPLSKKTSSNPEKYQELIKELRKVECNKKCAECGDRGPQSVVLDFCVFVCMTCSGIHREFNHKVKSISMYNFTKDEYEAFKVGGNEVGAKIFLHKWKASEFQECQPGDVNRIREFISV